MSKKIAIDKLLSNRKSPGIQEYINEEIQEQEDSHGRKKKATFDFDLPFHTELKIFAAEHNKKMVEIVTVAVKEYMSKYKAK